MKNDELNWDDGDIPINREEVRKIVRECFLELVQEGYIQMPESLEPHYVTTKQFAQLSEVSRQTVTSWRKSLSLKPLMERIVKTDEGKSFFDINGLRRVLK